ncbi:ribosomal RNA small subunit methyltransferase E [Kineosporia sp. NBRC 101677]|uniref:16S rRNA (uracil(1498)-N(3))-methyltransferase n=1 Tax=Kineosporia sp. NBRC 101677 TaxID=3032197 RepID=UPI0024A20C28|nr:16S rRNA (uracil(1498)-N(3))-methyltransferase [Kineosporia sp. NBRC 101677]GLY18080.1 ribosomal RNA small subunit methyltransferase E [Kineosporia sp. NBRC 101677]
MTLPRFFAAEGALSGVGPQSALVLDGEEGRHAASVRRIRAGETVELADGSGVVARCDVTASTKDRLDLLVTSVEQHEPPALRFGLVQALAKGGRDEQAVETATEVGVDLVLPWQAGRSVSRWEGPKVAKNEKRWATIAREAAKQSRRPRIPVVEPLRNTSALAKRLAEADLALVLHEDATVPLVEVKLPAAGEVLLVVGPEGGIGEPELAALTEAGATPVRLGPEVLRTSSAGPVALGHLAAVSGRWA